VYVTAILLCILLCVLLTVLVAFGSFCFIKFIHSDSDSDSDSDVVTEIYYQVEVRL